MLEVVTIGHSNHPVDRVIRYLQRSHVTAVADVRSTPASKYSPQFDRRSIEGSLRARGIGYVFLGKELGARTTDLSCYVDGRVNYELLAKTPAFASGIARVIDGTRRERIALMCAEHDPIECHRSVLISRLLGERGINVSHIRADGSTESQAAAMTRLRAKFGLAQPSLLDTEEELMNRALSLQELEIAYVNRDLVAG